MEVVAGTVFTIVDDDGVAAEVVLLLPTVANFIALLGTIVGDGIVEACNDITTVVEAGCVDGVVTTVAEPFGFFEVINPILCTLPTANGR